MKHKQSLILVILIIVLIGLLALRSHRAVETPPLAQNDAQNAVMLAQQQTDENGDTGPLKAQATAADAQNSVLNQNNKTA